MSYGLKRWAMGNFFGASLMGAAWLLSQGEPGGYVFAGLAIVLFFGDFLVTDHR